VIVRVVNVAEWLKSDVSKFDSSNYYLRHRLVVRDETWEFWQGFRERAMVRYRTGSDCCDFHGEWLGWDHVLKLYFEVEIPAEVRIGGGRLNTGEIEDFAARMHLALCSMKERHAVVRKVPWPPLPESERGQLLHDFKNWMEQRGWKVTASLAEESVSIKANGLRMFRRRATRTTILEQGAWVAKAYHALLYKEVDRTVLFVSEGARQTSSWLAELSW